MTISGEMIEIKPVDFPADLDVSVKIIREAFTKVTEEFKLTVDNCPSNPAFIESDILLHQLTEYRELYLLYNNSVAQGFIAIEKSLNESGTYYIEKVAVLPEYRHKGLGKRILQFAQDRITQSGGIIASIAIIDENIRLKDWYKSLGFKETGIRKFDHLPFTVCFMKKQLRS